MQAAMLFSDTALTLRSVPVRKFPVRRLRCCGIFAASQQIQHQEGIDDCSMHVCRLSIMSQDFSGLCAGLLGDGVQYLLEMVKRKVVQPTARVVPAAATMYCMGIEAVTPPVLGFDMSALDQYRSDAGNQTGTGEA